VAALATTAPSHCSCCTSPPSSSTTAPSDAVGQIGHPIIWSHLRTLVASTYPDRPDLWLAAAPVQRHHYLEFKRTYLVSDATVAVLQLELESRALEIVDQLSLLDVAGRGSWTNPSPSRAIAADGTVLRSISEREKGQPIVDPETGEILGRRRADHTFGWHTEGGNPKKVLGHKHLIVSTRGDDWMERVILAIERVEGGELAVALPVFDRLLPRLPGTMHVLYDGAMHGKEIDHLMRTHGVLPVAPMSSKRGRKALGQERVEKNVLVEHVTAAHVDGRKRSVEVWAVGGEACELDHDESGTRVYVPLTTKQILRRADASAYRFYADYVTEDGYTLRLPLHQTKDDKQRKFNRPENLRAYPPRSDAYKNIYGRRNDTESTHRQLKDALNQRRASSYGSNAVLADTLGWAIGHNAVAAHLAPATADLQVAA
jgi:hypothetical protein